MAQYPNMYNVELTKGPAVVQLAQMFLGDALANRIGAIVTENGEAVTLGGSCAGSVVLANGGTVAVSGTVSGNQCYIDLPSAVYTVEGPVEVYVSVTNSGTTTTFVAAFGNVRRTETGTVIDPGTIIPSVSALIDAIDEAVESIPADYSALSSDVAYQKKQAMLMRDAELGKINLLDGVSWSLNYIGTDGIDQDNGYCLRTDDFIDLTGHTGAIYYQTSSTEGRRVKAFFYDSSKNYVSSNASAPHTGTFSGYLTIPAGVKYVRFVYANEYYNIIFPSISVRDEVKLWICTNKTHMLKAIPLNLGKWGLNWTEEYLGHVLASTENRATSDLIAVGAGTKFEIPVSQCLDVVIYDKDLNNPTYQGWASEYIMQTDAYVRVVLRYSTENPTIDDTKLAEMQNWVQIYYNAPTDYNFSQKRLDGEEVTPQIALVTQDNILNGQLWQPDFLSTTGANSNNYYTIRTKNYIPVQGGKRLYLDFSAYNTLVGRYCLYTADHTFISYANISSADGVLINLPNNAAYIRLSIGSDWDTTPLNDPTFGYDVVGYYTEPEQTYSEIYSSALDNAVAQYETHAEPERLGYVWLSDMHLKHSQTTATYDVFPRVIRAAREAAERSNADFIVIGGDIIDGESTTANIYPMLAEAFKPLAGCSVPVLWLMGNHDDNSYGTALTKAFSISLFAQRSEFYNDLVFGNMDNAYFYFDIPRKNKRIVCLNSIDYPSNKNGTNWWSLSQAQVEWFCITALNTAHDIVILSHMMPLYRYNEWGHGDDGGYQTDLCNAIAAYNSRSSLTLYGNTYNFANAQGHVKYIHAGHTHVEFDQTICDITAGGVECVVTGCVKQWNQGISSDEIAVDASAGIYEITAANYEALHRNEYGYKYYHWANRTARTINESLFDLVSAGANAVYCMRIGVGNSRTFSLT